MSKQHSKNDKLFDRNFGSDTRFASFNEHILKDRAFSLQPEPAIKKETGGNLDNRFYNTVEQWNTVNNGGIDYMAKNEDNDNFSNNNKIFSERFFSLQPNMANMDQGEAEEFFRDLSRQNQTIRKKGDVIKTGNITVNNPNKRHMYFADPNNVLAMKMATFYQYKLQNSFICSSFSLLAVLALFYMGTVRETEQEIRGSLGLSDSEKLYDGLFQSISVLNKSNSMSVNCAILINKKNSRYMKKEYVDLVKKIGVIDYFDVYKPDAVINKVNTWIEKNTNGLIKNVLDKDCINSLCEFILVNTVYFKSDWKVKFDKKLTNEEDFITLIGSRKVNMMKLFGEKLNYYENGQYQLVELPYKDNQFTMGIILEKELNDILIPPTDETLLSNIDNMRKVKVDLQLPKFTQETTIRPKDILSFLGINKMFNNADIDDILVNKNNRQGYCVNNIIQKAKIIVMEEGTEAAAATVTALEAFTKSIQINEPVINFTADHPFIYYIRHIPTNNILFTGTYC